MISNRGHLQHVWMWIVILIMFAPNLKAQNLVVANPANIFDARSSFINPAILPFQPSQLVLGMKVFHVGFLEDDKIGFRNNYFCISSPYLINENFVLGITGQYFSIPIYNQAQFSFLISHKFRNQFTIGVKYNIFSRSYDRTHFDQIDSWDPVFSDGTIKIFKSFGLGLLFFPLSDLSVGFSWDHINKPDVSLVGDGIHQPHLFDFGIRYSYRSISTSININLLQNSPNFSWMLESTFPEKGLIRVGYEMNAAKLEGQLHLGKGIWLNYGYDYPLYDLHQISSGSHQLSIIYDFDYERTPIIEAPEISIEEKKIEMKDRFFVSLSSDQLKIVSKKFKRLVGEEITKDKLHNLAAPEIGLLDSSQHDDNFYAPKYCYHNFSDKKVLNPKLSETYKSYLQTLSAQLQKDKKNMVEIFCKDQADKRAFELKEHFLGSVTNQVMVKSINMKNVEYSNLYIKENEKEIRLLFPRKAYFDIIGTKQKYDGNWKLEITDYWGQILQKFNGNGEIPSKIEWDWKDKYGCILQPDDYYYNFYWTDSKGNLQKTDTKYFKVIKIIRHLNVEITTKLKQELDSGITVNKIKFHN